MQRIDSAYSSEIGDEWDLAPIGFTPCVSCGFDVRVYISKDNKMLWFCHDEECPSGVYCDGERISLKEFKEILEERETNDVQPVVLERRDDWVTRELRVMGIPYTDNRDSGGLLWVEKVQGTAAAVMSLNSRGAGLKESKKGGKATGYESAWFLKEYPEEVEC